MEARQGYTQAHLKKPSAGMLGTRPYAERFSQKGWGAQPPRLLFGAPRAELYTQKGELSDRAPRDEMPTARAPLAAPEAGALPDSN